MKKNFLVILNDNEMSICPRVGGLAQMLDRTRLNSFYQRSKRHVRNFLARIPLVGEMATKAIEQIKDGVKAFFSGGMLFEELGFRYIGPVDGHDLPTPAALAARREDAGRTRCCCTSSRRRARACPRPAPTL